MKTKIKKIDAIRMKRRAQAQVRAELEGKTIEEEIAFYAAVNARWESSGPPVAKTKRA